MSTIRELLDGFKFNFIDECAVEQWHKDDVDLEEALTERVYEQEIIGNYTAIEYLSENDPSLTEALGLAHDLGYSPGDLNSEKLASILYHQNLLENVHTLATKLNEGI